MSLQPGKEGEAGQAIGDKYGSAIPWVAVVRAIGRAVDFGGGGASRKDRERFRAAGGSIVHQGKGRWKFTYQGQRVSERKAIKIGRQGGLPGGGGGSIADRPLPSGSMYDYRIWQYLQWLSQPRGPRTRGRKRKKKRVRVPQSSPLPEPWQPPVPTTDTQAEEFDRWERESGIDLPYSNAWGWESPGDYQMFTGMPTSVPNPDTVARGLPAILNPWIWGVIGVLLPSKIGDEPPLPMPTQPGQPTGPRRRYRVIRPTTLPRPEPSAQPQPAPRPAPVPTGVPDELPFPFPMPTAEPIPLPQPAPGRPLPGTAPRTPTPTRWPIPGPSVPPTPIPTKFDPWTLLPLLLTPPGAKPGRVRTPVQSPLPMDAPLTSPFAYGVPSPRTGEDQCDCTKRKKRKKSHCTNPITRRTTRTRGGRRYRTITRRLDCK